MPVIYLKSAYEGKNQMTFIDVDSSGEDCRNLGVTELVLLCARDTGNERIWAEFLRRFAPVIRFFVWRTLRNLRHGSLIPRESLILGIDEENDLFQNTMLRLVNRDCAVMKRFTGTREEEFVAYLAVISKSVVRDSLRLQMAHKRPNEHQRNHSDALDFLESQSLKSKRREESDSERRTLANEVWRISLRTIRSSSRSSGSRDREIFEAYFSKGFSLHEIARLKEIGLSKTAVENVLNRLTGRARAIVAGKPADE